MEEKINGEQPLLNKENVQSEIVDDSGEGTACLCENDGSLGKFKDTKSLLNAYNNLQAEFTKKCQKLSELSKELQIGDENQTAKGTENLSPNLNETPLKQNDESLQNPIYKNENWKEKVAEFLQSNPQAKEYSESIANEILQDASLQNSPYALDLAWARIMQKEYVLPSTLASDQNFIREKILSQESVRTQVIDEYFKQIQNKKIPPVITSSGKSVGVTKSQPTNLQEAKLLVEKLFNLKGN